MADLKPEYKNKLLKILEIEKYILENYHVEERVKETYLYIGNIWIKNFNNETYSLTQLKSIGNIFISHWNTSINIATEYFWIELHKNNLNFERKDELVFVLEKGRFRSVLSAIGAKKDWIKMKEFDFVQNRFTKEELEKMDFIIEKDEKNRYDLLKKSLTKNKFPIDKYFKFRDDLDYMTICGLWDKYFNKEEVAELHNIMKVYENSLGTLTKYF